MRTDDLDERVRLALAERFLEQSVLRTHRELMRWGTLTQQTPQIDSGYLGQHLVSLVTGQLGRGNGGRGKGHDLVGGSEVKVACTLSGMDTPRWNHMLGTDGDARMRNVARLLAHPELFYVLLDTTHRAPEAPLRARVWRVVPERDDLFRTAVNRWAVAATSRNLQLHPPCWGVGNSATLFGERIELPLMYEAHEVIAPVELVQTDLWDPRAEGCQRTPSAGSPTSE